MSASWVDFADIRARVSLEDVLFRYYRCETLTRQGNRVVGPCPVHGGDSPRAFHAELDRNVWHCFSQCAGGGNQLDLVAKREGISIRDAAIRLRDFFLGENVPPSPPANTGRRLASAPVPAKAPPPTPPPETEEDDSDDEDANAPLTIALTLKADHPHITEARKLTKETAEHFGVGWCAKGIMRGCIAIPIHDEVGTLVAYAGRRLRPADIKTYGKYKLPRGFKKDLVVYNLHRAGPLAPAEGLVVVEGFFSVFALFERGLKNVVATMGCAVSDAQLDRLCEATPRDVIVIFDGNDAGRAGARSVHDRLLERGVTSRLVHLADGMEPEDLSVRALRWLVRGMQELDLAEVSLKPRA